jgi:chorismate mutase
MVVTVTTPPAAEVRNAYVRARTSMRPSWMRVW